MQRPIIYVIVSFIFGLILSINEAIMRAMRLSELVHLFLSGQRDRLAVNTQASYRATLTKFASSMEKDIFQLEMSDIEAFINSGSNATKNQRLACLKSFFLWCEKYYHTPNPARLIDRYPADPPVQRVLTQEEYHLILAHSAGRNKAIFQFLANTGLRASELWAVRIANGMAYVTGKGRKRRAVPLNQTALQALHHIDFSKELCRRQLYRICVETAHKAGIEPFGPHAFRHYFATQLYLKGVPLATISRLLGHASIAVTEQVYLHIADEELIGITDVLT